jgi:hypothetical protein
MTIDLEGARCDEEAARLLPWYVTGRLSAADLERVSAHLAHCAICRNDIAHETSIRNLVKTDARVEYAPQAGLAKTLSRIDELSREESAPTPSAESPARDPQRRVGPLQWLTAAVVIQAIALFWLGNAQRHPSAAGAARASYATLSSDPPPHPSSFPIRTVFAPTMTVADLKALLSRNRLTIVRGPTDAGAFTLASTDPRVGAVGIAASVDALRRDAHVLFAEPAINDTGPSP